MTSVIQHIREELSNKDLNSITMPCSELNNEIEQIKEEFNVYNVKFNMDKLSKSNLNNKDNKILKKDFYRIMRKDSKW